MKEESNKSVNGPLPDPRDSQVSPEGIRAQLDRVISNPDFKVSKKVKTIFRVLVEETMDGRENQIYEPNIASTAQNRPPDPDPPSDPLIRIQVNQLRRALKGNDAGAGATDDGPRIELPEDRYTPVSHSEKK